MAKLEGKFAEAAKLERAIRENLEHLSVLAKGQSNEIISPLGPLPGGWRMVRLKEVVEKVRSGATPRGGERSYLPKRERCALIRNQNVFDRRFDETGLAFISDEQAAELAGAEVQAGDVLLNITGDGMTFARSALVPEQVLPACVNQQVMLIRVSREKCAPGFLLAYLTHPHRAIETAQVIEELIALAKHMKQANERGEALRLTEDELAFYDALEVNDSAVKVLGNDTLRTIARELVAAVRKNLTIDWTVRENVRAHLRVIVKRILRKYGYPPDKQEKATQTVLEQAEVFSHEWTLVEAESTSS